MAFCVCAKCGYSPMPIDSTCPNCGSDHRILLAAEEVVAEDKAAAARVLAEKHYQVEEGLTQIFRITARAEDEAARGEPIKLLEVNEDTVEAGVMPLHFGPVPAIGIPYSSIIIEVTPREFQKIQAHELKLPEGWEIGEELPRPSELAGDV